MATPGRPIDAQTRQQIVKLLASGVSIRETAKAQRVSPETVRKISAK